MVNEIALNVKNLYCKFWVSEITKKINCRLSGNEIR